MPTGEGALTARDIPYRTRRSSPIYIREGRFQRSLSLLTAATSIISGLEVAYEHYRGSYSRRVMYTPVILSVLLAIAGIAGFFSRRAARKFFAWLPSSHSSMPASAFASTFAESSANPAAGVFR